MSRVQTGFPREYRGWLIDGRNIHGMYVATGYSLGYGRVMGDTLAGVKLAIRETLNNGHAL